MYAIFQDGGKQYKVSEGDQLLVELRDLAEGQTELKFDQVLMVGEGEASKIGQPLLSGASVTATLVESFKMPKVVGIKFARRKGFKKKFGHRQPMMRVQIAKISG
ncbi:MAG: 50S ribosomal protein L21 [Phycisphaerae bacterium]